MRDDRERLLDILEAVKNIEKYAAQGFEAFSQNELIQVYFLHNLQIIGEAARNLTPEIPDKYPEIPWGEMIGLRNVLVHDYFRTDLEVIWGIVENDLPPLRKQVEAILRKLEVA